MKKIRWNLAITVLLLAVTTIISFCFFHFGNKYTANITVLYTLALILIALKTSGYIYGIIASIFCVFAVNYFFSYPYFRLNFTLDGYPVTFAGMLTIALIIDTLNHDGSLSQILSPNERIQNVLRKYKNGEKI